MYIVPSIVDEGSVESLILPALFLASRELYEDCRSKLNDSQRLGVSSVTSWDTCDLTGHESQTFVPMRCEPGSPDPITNTAPSRYPIPNVTVTFETWDGVDVGREGLFEIQHIRPDGAVDEFWVDAADVLDTGNLLEALSANV